MSSYIRSFRGKNFLKKYSLLLFSQKRVLPEQNYNLASCGSSFNRIRYYVTQSSTEQPNVSQNSQVLSSRLREEFYHIDSLLKRNSLVKGNAIKKLAEQVKRTVAGGVNITPQQILFLLQCCSINISRENEQTNIEMVTDIWNMCQEHGLPLDISHHNALLEIYLGNEHKFSPHDFLATLEEKDIQPNQITYSRLLARFCQDGDIEGATKILQLMKDKSLPVTEYVFNYLILGNARARDMEGARNILEIMKNNECPPSSKTYSTLLEAYAENGDMESIKQLLASCEQEEISFSYRSLLGLVCTLANCKEKDGALLEMIMATIQKADFDRSSLESTLLRLLDAGHDDVAHEVIRTSKQTGRTYYLSNVLRDFAASCTSLPRVVSLCDQMTREGVNITAFEIALESYLMEHKFDLALDLLRKMRERQVPLKEHYFYPLLCHFGKVHGREKAFQLVKEMVKMEINFSEEFFSTYFMPTVKSSDQLEDLEDIYLRLLSHRDIVVDKIYCGMTAYLLLKRDLKATAQFVKRFPRGLRMSIGRLLALTYLDVRDVDDTVAVLRQLLPFAIRLKRDEPMPHGAFNGIKEFLFGVIRGLKKTSDFEHNFTSLLTAMEAEGVGFPSSMVEPLVSLIEYGITDNIRQLLNRLSDPSLVLMGEESYVRQSVSSEELRAKLEEAEATVEGGDSDLKINLLCALMREKNTPEVETLMARLKCEEVSIPPAVLVRVLDLHLEDEKLTESQDVFHQLLNDYPEFRIHAHKILKYASLLVKQDKFQDACTSLQMASPENGEWTPETAPQTEQGSFRQRLSTILSYMVAKKDVTSLQLMQEILISRRYASPAFVLPPLVKYYLDDDNLEEAFSCYVKLAEEHQITSYNHEMLKESIVKENKEVIEKIMEINKRIHGDMNSSYTLAFALIDMDKLGPAEKIFRTPGFRAFHNRLNGYCQHLIATDRIPQLELLVKATIDLHGVDRPRLYEHLLDGMISLDDPQKALGVWLSMQEENAIPTDHFLVTLANFLRSKDADVPFVVPEVTPVPEGDTFRPLRAPPRGPVLSTRHRLARAVEEEDLTAIQDLWTRLKESNEEISLGFLNRMIQTFVKLDQVDKAFDETTSLLVKNQFPSRNSAILLMQKLASSGNVARIEHLAKYFDEDKKRNYMYKYYLGSAYISGNRTEEYLGMVAEKVQSLESTPDDLNNLGLTLGIMREIVTNHRQHYPLLERCAAALTEKGDKRLYSQLWDIHASLDHVEEAEKIYDDHLKEENALRTMGVCNASRAEKDTKRLDDLLKVVDRKEGGRERVKGFIFSTYIDILNEQGKFEEALKVLQDSLHTIKLEDYRLKALQYMEREFQKHQRTFPFNLSLLREDTSSSSSSSSSEEEK